MGATSNGSVHDKKLADNDKICYPPSVLLQDTGFQGYLPENVIIEQPRKKPRKQDRPIEDIFFNRIISSTRVGIEHIISGIKRLRVVKDIFRNLMDGFSDLVMEIACGLHNLRIEMRQEGVKVVNFLELCEQRYLR